MQSFSDTVGPWQCNTASLCHILNWSWCGCLACTRFWWTAFIPVLRDQSSFELRQTRLYFIHSHPASSALRKLNGTLLSVTIFSLFLYATQVSAHFTTTVQCPYFGSHETIFLHIPHMSQNVFSHTSSSRNDNVHQSTTLYRLNWTTITWIALKLCSPKDNTYWFW